MSRRSARCCVLLCAPLVLGTANAGAETTDAETRTTARDLAIQGAHAFEAQDYATALDLFTRASTLFKAPTISLMEARSLEKLGRLLEAADSYEQIKRANIPEDAPEAYRQAVVDARRECTELWSRIPRLVIRVRTSDGAVVSIRTLLDTKPVAPAVLDVQRPINPGTHAIEATAEGYLSIRRTVTLQESQQAEVELLLTRSKPTDGVAAITPLQPISGGDAGGRHGVLTRDTLGWVSVGIGGAALAVSAVTGVVALGKKSKLDSVCTPGCPPTAVSDIGTFRTTRTVSYVALFGGAALLGVGGYLLLGPHQSAPALGVSVSPLDTGIWGTF